MYSIRNILPCYEEEEIKNGTEIEYLIEDDAFTSNWFQKWI